MNNKRPSSNGVPLIRFSTKADMARKLGLNRNTIITWTGLPEFPAGPPWSLIDIVRWMIERRDAAEEMMVGDGADSEALERYKNAKAAMAELDLQERQGDVVRVPEMKETMLRWALVLRRAGENLGKRHGREAQQILTDALSECKAVIDRDLGSQDE